MRKYFIVQHYPQNIFNIELFLNYSTSKMIIKNLIIRNGTGIKGQKVCKQVGDQRNGVQVLLENENKS